MRVIVIGTGFVAQAYLRALHYLGYHPLILSRSWSNYCDRNELRFSLESYRPDWVINCAGYTGHTVDDCESHQGESQAANVEFPMLLADLGQSMHIRMIHISTGCMFTGPGHWSESDCPNFLSNVYQRHKAIGERFMIHAGAHVFRIRMPFSQFPHPRNWLTKLATHEKILDGVNSCTWIDEFAMRSWQMAASAPAGVYHAVQPGSVSTKDVAMMLYNANVRLAPVVDYPADEFVKLHIQRSEAVLDPSKFEGRYKTPGTAVTSAIDYCIREMAKNKKRQE